MREIRDGITVEEAGKWMLEMEANHYHGCIDLRIADLLNKRPRDDYPDSFYEQPTVGSYGRFWKPNSSDRWGYYTGPGAGKEFPYSCSDGFVYQTFEPGLPTDVDDEGMPK